MGGMDIVLGLLLGYGAVNGFRKGLFVELASLVSLIAGIWAAIKFSGAVGAYFDGHLPDDPKNAAIAAFVITFIAVVAGITLLAKTFTKIADFTGLGFFNRILGAFFGLWRMVIVLAIVLNFFLNFNHSSHWVEKEAMDESFLFYPILEVSDLIFPLLESWFRPE